MAFDGVLLYQLSNELTETLMNGRIDKIYQPEADEIIVSIRSQGQLYKLLMTANASCPRIHLTAQAKENPMNPPVFCMSLRKRLSGGKITNIYQPDFERILEISIESLNEMGDMTQKRLLIEIMGKHSNIILVNDDGVIIDCIKKVSHEKSSVREILPGKIYNRPPSQGKINPAALESCPFMDLLEQKKGNRILDIIYQSYTGISPVTAQEICFRAQLDSSLRSEELAEEQKSKLYGAFEGFMLQIKEKHRNPEIIYDKSNTMLLDFAGFDMMQYQNYKKTPFQTISEAVEFFYLEKDKLVYVRQRTHDLRKIIQNNIERCIRKKDIQHKTLQDTEKMETWRIKGELLNAYGSLIAPDTKVYEAFNYYTNTTLKITLDPDLTPAQNAQKFFDKYNKAKRTRLALTIQMEQNDTELAYLETLLSQLGQNLNESDIQEMRQELFEEGYVKKNTTKKSQLKKSSPLHYVSKDGYDIFVGKNNKQNEYLTLKIAQNQDLWLHTKDIPGSHVIIKTEGKEVPEQTIHQAAMLAAYHSKAKSGSLVPVDYTLRKYVKKPQGAKPGMVIYKNQKTAYLTPDESAINQIILK